MREAVEQGGHSALLGSATLPSTGGVIRAPSPRPCPSTGGVIVEMSEVSDLLWFGGWQTARAFNGRSHPKVCRRAELLNGRSNPIHCFARAINRRSNPIIAAPTPPTGGVMRFIASGTLQQEEQPNYCCTYAANGRSDATDRERAIRSSM
jgi:hypothetical protein